MVKNIILVMENKSTAGLPVEKEPQVTFVRKRTIPVQNSKTCITKVRKAQLRWIQGFKIKEGREARKQ